VRRLQDKAKDIEGAGGCIFFMESMSTEQRAEKVQSRE